MEAQQTDDQFRTIADRVMITNFAAIHTSSLVRHLTYLSVIYLSLTLDQSGSLTLLWLADHPEYIEPIREEIEEVIGEQGWTKAAMGKMWKLDSLLKEFQRHQGLGLGAHILLLLAIISLMQALDQLHLRGK